ncbi:MAG: ABC transporter ATP-binding protein [Clostridiales bacterium]|nr:ABC transporter ATP-binding protein [Clostridiales bacterium]
MKKLFKYMKEYRKEAFLGPLFKLLEASFEMFVPLVVAAVIDNGIPAGDKGYVLKMCGMLVLLASVGLTCTLFAQYFAAKASVGFVTKIRHALFCHIQSLSHTELDRTGISTLITRITGDVNQVQTGMNLTLRLLLRSPFVVFGAMIMAFTVDVKAALIFEAVIPVLAAVVFFIMLVSIPLYRKVQANLDRVLGITRENMTGSRVIRAFCKEDEEIAEFDRRNGELAASQRFVGRISALMNPLTYGIINVAVIALMWTGALRVNAGTLTQGEVVALYNYMSQILVELIKLANLIINITKSIACGNRIQQVLEIEPSVEGGGVTEGKPGTAAVEFKNVSLRYKGAAENSLENISFTAAHGETVGIIGGTGSGKSSLVNLIPRFYDTYSGEVLVDGVNVRDYDVEALRGKIAVVPQKAVLFRGTVRENLLWGKEDATEDELWAAVEASQSADIVKGKPGGLDSMIEQGGKNLSGGQRQRLTIARALVKNAEILIMDDSASALDFATDARLRAAIKSLKNKPCTFIVSQRASSVMHADKIIVLEDGAAVGIGTHEELLKGCSVYAEIYATQFRQEEENG